MENDEVETPNDAEVSDLIMEGSSQKGSPGLDKMDGNRPVFYMGEDILMRPRTPTTLSGEFKIVEEDRKIIVGVCAMAKKSQSKPMKEILHRLDRFEHIETLVFDEQVILTEPVENWPIVDALISFFSTGFPLDKAIKYKDLRQVFLVNDLFSQYALQDRREVYKILVREGISHPNYTVMNRAEDTKDSDKTFIETEDSVEVDGVTFLKPFVEKPVNAEDHNVYIYFPVSAGGGSQRLFRKIGSRSSFYSSVNGVRKTGSYIYEEFVPTDGTDVKVYTVGLDYAHAEARKSPALDGKVERDTHGKEVRYPVLLSAKEKVIARKVCQAFKQNVCGFDLLRTGGRSYVCDVNGFSFVKNSVKYYDDCAKILGTMVMRAVAPQLHIPWVLGAAPEDIPVVPTTSGSMMELRCVIAVIRHGDRTPKQKMKMEVKHRKWFELFEKYNGYKNGHLKLKKPKQLQEVLDIARLLLKQDENIYDPEVPEKKVKLLQLKLVLEMYEFTGIHRKIQFKYQPSGYPHGSSSADEEAPKEASLVLIVKWGGELTPAGRKQAEDLGKAFRTLYPGGQGQFEAPGLGFLRLHSTFRHDLKIYASDEGRVQMTAAAFTKGMLALEGELTPILVQMVKSAHTNGLLDSEGETSKYQHIVKERLMGLLNQDHDFTEEDYKTLAATNSISLTNAMDFIKNPKKMCVHVYDMIKELTARIRSMKRKAVKKGLELYHGESWELLTRRWAKLEKDFRLKDGRFEISKIPDIYDCIKYDLQHNLKTLEYSNAEELFTCSKALADIVIPQEYGITMEEKLHISQSFCTPLLRKTHSDLLQCMQSIEDEESTRLNSRYSKGVSSPERFVRTRLYFTSESHIHSLLNMLRFGGLCDINQEGQWKRAMDYVSATAELNYMTQIVIMMFEDPSKPPTSDERFHIELHFSPGAYTCCDTNVVYPRGTGWRTQSNRSQPKKLDTLGFKMSSSFPHSMRTDTFDKTGRKIEEISKATIQETAEELNESEIFEKHTDNDTTDGDKDTKLTSDKASNAEGPSKKGETWSPDPNIPEWDWGDDCGAQKKGFKTVADANTKTLPQDIKQASNVAKSDDSSPKSPTSISDPISIQASPVSTTRVKRMSDPGETEEKRSRSLEDKKASTREDRSVYVDRHYLTVQLPLASEKYRHSFTNLFYLNPDAYRAFEGFSMVPTLRPLETLHNALTMKTMDAFLTKAITTKFVTPLSSPAFGPTTLMLSPRPPVNGSRGSAPSSSSSSAGPSSPTTTSTPIDIVSKLNKYIQSKVEMQEKSQAQKPNSLSVEKCPEDDKKDVDCQKATITKNGNG